MLYLTKLKLKDVVTKEKPTKTEAAKDWEEKDVDAKIAIAEKQVFEKLDSVFQRSRQQQKWTISGQLQTLKLGCDITLYEHFPRFDSLVTDYEAAGNKLDKDLKSSYLLHSLSDTYKVVKIVCLK